ncbi:MAG TPA: hypothetical protein GXX33_05830 [Firmicutes bacterium]|uniref:Uncharacterized protein n=1 Tax=Capillibacterium thermochitinicola TaxID=2699427 RepID=A0A8J6HRI7_9FIRM|nr:hypothetical protein [Capillibacterium thermochitinicola]MBA2132756.1 hypothetical protein [Capillibacterium thermochitinicola]HHW12503.1 hypothetical protein [Bacillota bacterium]
MDIWVCVFCGKKVQINPPNCYLYDEGAVCVECHHERTAKEAEDYLHR